MVRRRVCCVVTQATAKAVSEDVANVMSSLGDMLSDSLEMGDPPALVRTGKMTMDVNKQTAHDLAKYEPRSHIGSIRIAGRFNVPDPTCLVSQVYAAAENLQVVSYRILWVQAAASMSTSICVT